jgi:Xaa-Pro aminopeptidase
MLCFETVSFAPIDLRLVEVALLSADDRAWLNAYHAALPAKVVHLLDDAERAWLAEATRAV